MARLLRRPRRARRALPGPLHHALAAATGDRAARRRTEPAQHRLHQHDPARARAVVPRRRGGRAPDPAVLPVERRDHGPPRAAPRHRRRRPHLDLRVDRVDLRGRLQPLLPRQGPPRRRRPDLLPGPRLPRHLRPVLPGGAAVRAPDGRVPPGALAPRRRAVVVPAPAPHARLLGVPHRLDGPGPAERDLPGPLQQVPAPPRHQGHQRPAGVGLPRRRRDGRGREPRRDRRRGARGARQPHLRHQLQPAAPRRSGTRQRQDHPGARVATSAAPAGTSSRSSGAVPGTSSSRRTTTAPSSTS